MLGIMVALLVLGGAFAIYAARTTSSDQAAAAPAAAPPMASELGASKLPDEPKPEAASDEVSLDSLPVDDNSHEDAKAKAETTAGKAPVAKKPARVSKPAARTADDKQGATTETDKKSGAWRYSPGF
jgi:hypothetical protein